MVVRTVSTDAGSGRCHSLDDGSSTCEQVVLCNGASANGFEQAQYARAAPGMGSDRSDRTSRVHRPCLLVGDGFTTSMHPHWGAGRPTNRHPWAPERATEFNLATVPRVVARPDRRRRGIAARVARLRGMRAVASDRMPVIGALFDARCEPMPRLLVDTGHGSQGTGQRAVRGRSGSASEHLRRIRAAHARRARRCSVRGAFALRQARRGARHGARHLRRLLFEQAHVHDAADSIDLGQQFDGIGAATSIRL